MFSKATFVLFAVECTLIMLAAAVIAFTNLGKQAAIDNILILLLASLTLLNLTAIRKLQNRVENPDQLRHSKSQPESTVKEE